MYKLQAHQTRNVLLEFPYIETLPYNLSLFCLIQRDRKLCILK